MHIAILGRQPAIGIAELESLFTDVRWFSDQSALVNTSFIDIEQLGGSLKTGRVVAELPRADWRQASMKLVKAYTAAWAQYDGKLTLGISTYGFDVSTRDVQKTGLVLKSKLKNTGVSLRLVPNTEPALSTATSHHNKLGLADNKVELLIVRARNGRVVIAESAGSQNITALARRDQQRPKRDAFVGMLPPKLAQIMINLARPSLSAPLASSPTSNTTKVPASFSKQGLSRLAHPHENSLSSAELAALRQSSTSKESSHGFTGSLTNASSKPASTLAAHATPNIALEFKATPARVADGGAAPASDKISDFSEGGADRPTGPAASDLRGDSKGIGDDGSGVNHAKTLLDPFCGTGVLLQEALLLGYNVYGTDLSEKMIQFSDINLAWIKDLADAPGDYRVDQGDAMTATWNQPIDAVACETYLGQPFSAPPSPAKLTEVRGNCDHIISQFLKNLAGQITPGTPLCIAVPAWRAHDGSFTHLPLIGKLAQLGYEQVAFKNLRPEELLYYREDQVVARELLVLKKQ